jgi:hypothetical protein
VAFDIMLLGFDWDAYRDLPDDDTLTTSYLAIVIIGTMLTVVMLLQRGFVLMQRRQTITHPTIDTEGNRTINKLGVELKELRDEIIWNLAKIITLFIRELPMMVVGFLILASSTTAHLILTIAYGVCGIAMGFKLLAIPHFFHSLDMYAKGLQLRALLEEKLKMTGSLDDIGAISISMSFSGVAAVSQENLDGSTVEYSVRKSRSMFGGPSSSELRVPAPISNAHSISNMASGKTVNEISVAQPNVVATSTPLAEDE